MHEGNTKWRSGHNLTGAEGGCPLEKQICKKLPKQIEHSEL